MNDPASGVPLVLLPHIHLVSTYRYPILSTVSIETMVDYLVKAQQITKEVAPMNWMFLDAPPDGTVLLVWQPLMQLQTRFASDGYTWADSELSFCQEYRGYNVEMYIHRSGYHPAHEAVSAHCRRRYRLTPGPNPDPNLPPCDPALWIVHYSRADPQNQYPVNRIPVNPQAQTMMAQRNFLQRQGQLVRKEFMLLDRNNWPTINHPSGMPQYGTQPAGYPANIISHMSRSQQQVYMQDPHASAHHHPGPPPAKRPRQTPPTQRPGSSSAILPGGMSLDPSLDEEEDYAKGDYMDLITPREISSHRYKQHHEWMEEIFSSPFATGQIIPVALGLGRKGELESLTHGFFDAPTGGTPKSDAYAEPQVPNLGPGRAAEFSKRATEKIAEINAEMEKMKYLHDKRMSRLRQGSIVQAAEKRLRNAVSDPLAAGNRTTGLFVTPTEADIAAATIRQQARIDEIATEVEAALDRKIEAAQSFRCVQKGGLEEKAPPGLVRNQDTLASTSVAAMFESTITEPIQVDEISSFPDFDDKADWLQGDADPVSDNLDLGNTPGQGEENNQMPEQAMSHEPKQNGGDSGDWVMVDQQGEANTATVADPPHLGIIEGNGMEHTDLDKLGAEIPDFGNDVPDISGDGFESTEFGDGVDFGNLDTAGDALAGYGEQNDGMETDEAMGLTLEDSAFGDAFHQTETNTPNEAGGG